MKAIETSYNNYKFRSRLEARWAVYFDVLNLEYVYEPEGYQEGNIRYLPDFWLPMLECFAEVKPRPFTESEFDKTLILPKPCILLDTPYPKVYMGYLLSTSPFRVVLGMSALKKRLWVLLGEDIKNYALDMTPEIKAKSARFEHGENSTIRI
jgi:hypothetical protein